MRHYIAVFGVFSTPPTRGVLLVAAFALLPATIIAATCDGEQSSKSMTVSELATVNARVERTAWAKSRATQRASDNRISTLEADATRNAVRDRGATVAPPRLAPPVLDTPSLKPPLVPIPRPPTVTVPRPQVPRPRR